ncbi:MAG: nickel-dependent hydrogenase large subunit [Acidobacteria bacterium]|nr:nickel-dependent hydrogenase large subunit [Acidobacteriota bacterium]
MPVVFKSLPIQFDAYGRAHLRDGEAEAPFNFVDEARLHRAHNRVRTLEQVADHAGILNFSIDPLTRASTSLTLHILIDFEHRRVLDAHVEDANFCGYEVLLKERRPSDATQITSRISGSASGAHTIAAAMAVEMAVGVKPPPLAIISRNLGSCAEMLSENTRHLFLLAGPDYSEAAVSRTNLSVWAKAQATISPGVDVHGLETIADIMRGMNPMSGHLYLEALQMARLGCEIATMIFGKYPHPTTVFPGGIGIEASKEIFNQILGRLNSLLDYAKKVAAIWDDLIEFFYDADPHYRRVGELPGNLLCVGCWDDPESYDASYANCNTWGERRMAVPGILTNIERRTTRLSDVNIGMEEFVDHSYFAEWDQKGFPIDPLSGPLSPWHPWNKETIPAPAERDWKGRYSWSTAPRWDREPMETGPIALLWNNAVSDRRNCEFIRPNRRGLEIDIPAGRSPAVTLNWQIPERPNTLERNRARAYQLAYAGMVAYACLLKAFDCVRTKETEMSERFHLPERSIGAGFWESSKGAVTHHVVIRNQCIANYQVITPTEWMGSPRDISNVPGIFESAVMNTPLLEECARSEDFTGIDILRTIRSFDP